MEHLKSIDVTGKTMAEVVTLGAPETATFEYAGCGSHEVHITWYEPFTPEEVEQWNAAVAETNRRNEEARDRRERRKGLPIIDDTKLGF